MPASVMFVKLKAGMVIKALMFMLELRFLEASCFHM